MIAPDRLVSEVHRQHFETVRLDELPIRNRTTLLLSTNGQHQSAGAQLCRPVQLARSICTNGVAGLGNRLWPMARQLPTVAAEPKNPVLRVRFRAADLPAILRR